MFFIAVMVPITSYVAIHSNEPLLWLLPIFYAFGAIPLGDLLIKIPYKPHTQSDITIVLVSLIYSVVTFEAFWTLRTTEGLELVLKSVGLGISSGVIGINVAHELGHRRQKGYQNLAKFLLWQTGYMHFFVEHNKGHHRFVATAKDPATSRKGESLYAFLPRTIWGSFLSAWKIEAIKPWWKNKVLHYLIYQLTLLGALFYISVSSSLVYLISSCVGVLLLEIVNYIEHYGLVREAKGAGFERVQFHHSWDSSHYFSRIHLFNLSLHSDHHALASKPFQDLVPHHEAPQMPTGYPGMMLLSLVPPLWFLVMDKKL